MTSLKFLLQHPWMKHDKLGGSDWLSSRQLSSLPFFLFWPLKGIKICNFYNQLVIGTFRSLTSQYNCNLYFKSRQAEELRFKSSFVSNMRADLNCRFFIMRFPGKLFTELPLPLQSFCNTIGEKKNSYLALNKWLLR